MSAYGLQILNSSNEYLINSEWTNLHFAGQATYVATSSHIYSTVATTVNGVSGSRSYVTWFLDYDITLNNNTASPLPFFNIPLFVHNYSVSTYGVSKTANQTWRIKLIVYMDGLTHDGFSYSAECPAEARPQVYIFSEPGGAFTQGSYGMQVFNDYGRGTFDSTKRPLMVEETITITASQNPVVPINSNTSLPTQPLHNFSKYGEVSANFPNGRFIDIQAQINTHPWVNKFLDTTYAGRQSVEQTTLQRQQSPIFMYSPTSMACVVNQTTDYQEQAQGGVLGIGQSIERKWWETNYWTQYRTAMRKHSETSNYVIVWWIPIAQSIYYWGIEQQGGSWLSFNDAESGATNYGGIYPHETASTNVTAQPIIIADGFKYSSVNI